VPPNTPRDEPVADPATVPGAIVVSPHFKLVFLVVAGFTLLFVIADVLFALASDQLSANQQTMFDGMNFAWKAGFGAILGLLGGKAIN